MKIAIASDDEKTIAGHFGRTRGFMIYDVQDGNINGKSYILNTFTGHARGLHQEHNHHHHGHNHGNHVQHGHAPIIEALGDCQVVISRGMGRRIYNDLMQAKKEVFITDEVTLDESVEKYIKSELVDNPDKGCEH